MTHPGLRRHLIAQGYARARSFSWLRIAEASLDLTARIDSDNDASTRRCYAKKMVAEGRG
jgi:hypothetical protein